MSLNQVKIEIPKIKDEKKASVKVVCDCKKSSPANSFKQLVELVKQAEELLIKNGHKKVEDRIHILRGIYYGTKWSLDYEKEKSEIRNFAFNYPYTHSGEPLDAREELKCFEECKSNLFFSLYNSYEVFDSAYVAVDFGHLIIGLDARRSWLASHYSIPSQGGTGLGISTWIGDLGGGVGKLSIDRVSNSNKRAKTIFPSRGHSYGAMVNLEGDVAAYVVGMNEDKPHKIVDSTDFALTIHEGLSDYFNKKWDNRALYFLKMLGGNFTNNTLENRDDIEKKISNSLEDFAAWYTSIRMKEQGTGGIDIFKQALGHFKPVSEEVASIFIDALLHVIKNPKDMITARTNPDPKPRVVTKVDISEKLLEEAEKSIKEVEKSAKEFIDKYNPFK